jgi:hypothetical protein
VDLSGDQTDYFNVSYETLARGRRQWGEAQWDNPFVSWIPTYNGFETNILLVAPKAWGSPRSKLADLLLDHHRDRDGKPRLRMTEAERRRILAWIDLNVPYYGTSETTYPDNPGSRRIYPPDLDRTLAGVAANRCAGCHPGGKVPRPFWTRLTNPQWNSFLRAPLAKEAGGSGACGQSVFATARDPESYTLETFTHHYYGAYGGPEIEQADQRIISGTPSADGLGVRLVVDNLVVGHIHELHLPGLRDRSGQRLLHDAAYYTLNQIPKE